MSFSWPEGTKPHFAPGRIPIVCDNCGHFFPSPITVKFGAKSISSDVPVVCVKCKHLIPFHFVVNDAGALFLEADAARRLSEFLKGRRLSDIAFEARSTNRSAYKAIAKEVDEAVGVAGWFHQVAARYPLKKYVRKGAWWAIAIILASFLDGAAKGAWDWLIESEDAPNEVNYHFHLDGKVDDEEEKKGEIGRAPAKGAGAIDT